jgi:class 3 adenylate cyclase/tetratricopeptide (TPR) repeat protein
MNCPKCLFDNPEGMLFCGKCGARLDKTCPSCHFPNPVEFDFCGRCGSSLGKVETAPAIDYSQPHSYTPKFLADKILSGGKALEGERKVVTVLFADVVNYTGMSEKLDPEEVHQIMDGCFHILMDEIHRYEGTIDKFTGDGVMALFGAPIAHEDHAQRACYAALAIQKALKPYGQKTEREIGIPFKMRLGLNSGPVIVSSIGSDLKMEYSAVGDTVNLASRLQTAATPDSVLVSRDVHKMTRDFFRFKPLGKLEVKGKQEKVEAYELLEPTEIATRIEASVVRGLTRFVGRKKEMATLKEAFDLAQSGSGQIVCIVGEAGVGKSRLLLELRRSLSHRDHAYLEGHCLHYGSSMPYLPLLDILRSYFDIQEGEREFVIKKRIAEKVGRMDGGLKTILPPLHELLSLKVEDEGYARLDPVTKREKTFEAIRDLLIRESQDQPLVIAIEDLHWIDRTSEEFLRYFIDWLPKSHILLLPLYRPEYTHQWGSRSCYSQIRVDELPLKSSAELVSYILEDADVAPELRDLILKRAAGNPLFMEEFTHALVENGSIQRKDHEYFLATKPGDLHVPDTIQGIIAARMDRLDDNLKRIMQVASVIGRDFAYRILQTITGMQEELKSHLLNLQGLEFIYEKSLFPELEYIFKHALTQEVAYNSLLQKRRKEIHQRIGKAIEDIYPDRLEEFYEALAHHYSMSEDWGKAFQYLKLSGLKASLGFSLQEAVGHYKQAISVLGKLPATEENKRAGIEIRLLMDFPLFGLGFPGDSIEIFQEGERLSRELGDGKSEANFQTILSCCSTSKGRAPEGLSWGETAFRRAEQLDDVDLMVASGFEVCQCAANLGQLRKVVEVSAKCIAVLEKTQRQADYYGRPFNTYSALLAMQGAAMGMMGRFKEAEECCEKSLRFLRTIDNRYGLAMTEAAYGNVLAFKGDGERALEHCREALQHCEATQFVTIVGTTCNGLGAAHMYQGEMEAARLHLERGIKTSAEADMSMQTSPAYFLLGMVNFFSGDLASAQRCAEEALGVAQSNAERAYEGMSWFLLGAVLGAADPLQSGRAEEYLLKGTAIEEELGARTFSCMGHFFLGQHYANSRQRDKALEHLTKARSMSEEMGIDFWLVLAQISLDSLGK